MTVVRYVFAVIGALTILGAILPGARVLSGRFSTTQGPPLARSARIGMFAFGLLFVVLAMSCGRS